MSKRIVFLLIFFILIHGFFLDYFRWQLPEKYIQKSVCITGVIDSVPQKKFRGESFVFHVTKFNHQKINTHFLIAWYREAVRVKVGQSWQLMVKLKPPVGSHNPGGFNYADFLIHKNIVATGYVIAHDTKNKLLHEPSFISLNKLREKIHQHIFNSINNMTLAAFISALCVGIRDGLTQSDWQVFQKTGTNHLVAIAGLHIGFVVAAIYFLMTKIVKRFPAVLLRMPASRIAGIAALSGALIYAALSGFAIPAQRATIMLFLLMIIDFFYRAISMFDRWLCAAMIVLLAHPFDIDESSFWLSFVSVGLLIWVMSGRMQFSSHLAAWGKMQLTMVVGLLPLMLWYFQQISFISFLANAIAIPWVGFIILPLCLSACMLYIFHLFYFSRILFFLSGKMLYPLWKILVFFSSLPMASWHHGLFTILICIAGIIAVLLLLAPQGFPGKLMGFFGLLPLFFYHPSTPVIGNFDATVIDVGQGLSVLIRTKNHVMLYDTGAHFPGGFDYGESVVTPYLREVGVTRINRLEISHGDNDHSGGANAIVKNFRVDTFFSSAPKLIQQFHGVYCTAGQTWQWDEVRFETFSPTSNAIYEDNNSSCVIKITGKYGQLLLTGDIQRETESQLVNQYGNQLHAIVLIVPHHGSRTSSSNAFLSVVSPQYAVISAGKYNRYHLPAPSVVNRYHDRHIQLYNTADVGAVNIRFLRAGRVELGTG